MNHDILFAGFGGQGVLTAGLVLAQMGVDAGLEVLWSPAYGGEMRGGKAYSMVKLSDAYILDPGCEYLTALVAMNGPALDFTEKLQAGGVLIVNDIVTPEHIPQGDWKVFRAPLQTFADENGNPRSANLAAVGCAVGALGLFDRAQAEAGVRRFFERKGKAALGVSGAAALGAGYAFCTEQEA